MSDSHDKLFESALDHAKSAYHDHRYDEAKEYLAIGLRMIPIKKAKGKPEPKIEEVVVEKQPEINYGLWSFCIVVGVLFIVFLVKLFGGNHE